jgi:hypothetical protein
MTIPTRNPENGYSLIELMVILMGAAVIAAVAVPTMKGMLDNYNIAFAAQEISTELHFAKFKAISSNESYRVNFQNASYYQVELSDGALVRGPVYLPSGIQPYTPTGGQAVTFPGNYVLFQPDGTVPVSGDGSAGRIKLVSHNGLHADVLVDQSGIIRNTPSYTGSTPPF